MGVSGWHLNHLMSQLELRVHWDEYDEATWEPNCNSQGYQDSIWDFLSKNTDLPKDYPAGGADTAGSNGSTLTSPS